MLKNDTLTEPVNGSRGVPVESVGACVFVKGSYSFLSEATFMQK